MLVLPLLSKHPGSHTCAWMGNDGKQETKPEVKPEVPVEAQGGVMKESSPAIEKGSKGTRNCAKINVFSKSIC